MIKEIDIKNGQETVRDFTIEEKNEREALAKMHNEKIEKFNDELLKKQKLRNAILEKLGLTEEEAAVLLG